MKIVFLVAGFPPKWLSGAEIATYHIAKHLAKLGHEVHVVTSLDKGLSKETTERGFYIHRVRAIRKPNLFTLSFLIPAFREVKRINPDVIHAQSVFLGLCAFLAKKGFGKPYVVCSHGELYFSWAFKALISKQVFANANAVIALTDDMKRTISEVYTGDVYVVPNGIELEDFGNLSKDKSRRELNIGEGDRVLIFVGRFRPEKDMTSLIKAMRIMVERNQKVKLVVVGGGPQERRLKKLAAELNLVQQVNFVGQVPHEKVSGYMAAADVLVLPSLSEGFPVVLPEAMACGLPIVATKVGGIPEIVTDGENGLLVEPRNPEQIAEAVLIILEHDELAQRQREAGGAEICGAILKLERGDEGGAAVAIGGKGKDGGMHRTVTRKRTVSLWAAGGENSAVGQQGRYEVGRADGAGTRRGRARNRPCKGHSHGHGPAACEVADVGEVA
jgi:glycosyltransferase involved in cell wall biosynthesis